MNCQTFEPAVGDLARGQIMEATLRESALAHAEECARCRARLADERALSFNLRSFAASVETEGAPAQVETTLRAAFRQRQTVKQPVPPVVSVPARSLRWMPWATAAAAAVVTVLAMQAFRLRQTPAPLLKADNATSLSQLKNLFQLAGNITTTESLSPVNDEGSAGTRSTGGLSSRAMSASNYTPISSKDSRSPRAAKASPADPEIMTDFMPLTYGAALNPNEGAQLVRVELPRSALASLGLPVNADQSDERVKADVLLGHDGMARAIRFVR